MAIELRSNAIEAQQASESGNNCPEKNGESAASSQAIKTLRGIVILIVLAFHSVLAYLSFLGTSPFPFDRSAYEWRAFPMIDSNRWFGFDIFCAWQDVYLMSLMFFLSALFTWPSLRRKKSWKFLSDRILRLGVPFVFALAVVMPIALYPVYRITAIDPGLIAYGQHFLALPFWPNGPMWFLWQLLALTILAAGVHRCAPHFVEYLGRLSSSSEARPGRYFLGLAIGAILAYVPMALAFTPWQWSEQGPLAIQFCRPLLYAVFYFAGLGIGAYGLERGLLSIKGKLAEFWGVWLAGALLSFLLWIGLTSLAISYGQSAPFVVQLGVGVCFALACTSGCFAMMAGCLHFVALRSRIIDNLSENAFGLYILHYVFVVWLQYAALGVALFAIAKAVIVFGGTLILAWVTTIALRSVRFGARLIGEEPRGGANKPLPRGTLAGERPYRNDHREIVGPVLIDADANLPRSEPQCP